MTASPPTALVVAAHTDLDPVDVDGDQLRRLAAGWLLGYSSPHTRRAYVRDLTSWTGWCAGLDVDPLAAERLHVDAWARHLTEGLALAPASVARRLAAVSAFYRWCVLEQHLATNPAVHVRRPEVDPDASTTLGLSAEQARAVHRGRRALRADARARRAAARRRPAHQRGPGTRRRRRPGRRPRPPGRRPAPQGRPHRPRRLPPLVADAVDTYLAHRADLTPGYDEGPPPGQDSLAGPLFITRTGARWRPGNAARALTALAARAGVPGAARITPHALRHAAITPGVPLHEVQDFAGHRDPRSTRRYDRARGRLDRHASYALAAHLG